MFRSFVFLFCASLGLIDLGVWMLMIGERTAAAEVGGVPCTDVRIVYPCWMALEARTCRLVVVDIPGPGGQLERRIHCSQDSCREDRTDDGTGSATVGRCQAAGPGEIADMRECRSRSRHCGQRVDGPGRCVLIVPPDPEDWENYFCYCEIDVLQQEECTVTSDDEGVPCAPRGYAHLPALRIPSLVGVGAAPELSSPRPDARPAGAAWQQDWP